MPDTQKGKIKFFNIDKGYGFIKADSGLDYFYHITDLSDENYRPQPDDHVIFDVTSAKRGLKATNVSQQSR